MTLRLAPIFDDRYRSLFHASHFGERFLQSYSCASLQRIHTLRHGQDQAACAWWSKFRCGTSPILLDQPVSTTIRKLCDHLPCEELFAELLFRPLLWPIAVGHLEAAWQERKSSDSNGKISLKSLVKQSKIPAVWRCVLEALPDQAVGHHNEWDTFQKALTNATYTREILERSVQAVVVNERDLLMSRRLASERKYPDELCVAVVGELHISGMQRVLAGIPPAELVAGRCLAVQKISDEVRHPFLRDDQRLSRKNFFVRRLIEYLLRRKLQDVM